MSEQERAKWQPAQPIDTRPRQEIILEYAADVMYAAGTMVLPEGFEPPTKAEFDQALLALRDRRSNGWNSSPAGPRVSKIGL